MAFLLQIIEANSQCADCYDEPVMYVSKTFGVTLCNTCAQIHSDIGLQVKSFDDPFHTDECNFIASRGNANVNSSLCKAVPPWYVQPKDFPVK